MHTSIIILYLIITICQSIGPPDPASEIYLKLKGIPLWNPGYVSVQQSDSYYLATNACNIKQDVYMSGM